MVRTALSLILRAVGLIIMLGGGILTLSGIFSDAGELQELMYSLALGNAFIALFGWGLWFLGRKIAPRPRNNSPQTIDPYDQQIRDSQEYLDSLKSE